MRTKITILIILSIFADNLLKAQQFTASTKLDTFQIEIGDQVYLKLNVTQAKDQIVKFPQFNDTLIDGIEIISVTGTDTIHADNNTLKISKKLLITSFEDSLFNIPKFAFTSGIDTVYSNPVGFAVQMVSLDSAEISKIDTTQMLKIFDVKSPIDVPWTFKEFLLNNYPYIISIVVLLSLALLIWYIIKRYKDNKPIFKISKPKEPAHVIALRSLNELKEKKLWQMDREKAYYSELSYILREYIENRYNISALERTSHELLELIRHSNLIEKDRFLELSQVLKLADLAKFAKFKPLPNENDLSLTNAFSIVNNTIPEVVDNENNKEEDQILGIDGLNASVNSNDEEK
ncbi:MAG: hypothetical protein B6I20_04200 [Bacteroidetes bacterium 4572_117]|nr:MAG: hypothetical protein B6I20_04200 [Bacteroidetes bacterium 4572_117]